MQEQPKCYVNKNGYEIWFLPSKGKDYYHREDGPSIIQKDGTEMWHIHGKLHREDGPAVAFSSTWLGLEAWWINGMLHRGDGPAVTRPNEKNEWWINGNQLDECKVEEWLKENEIDLKTEIGQIAFKLRWA